MLREKGVWGLLKWKFIKDIIVKEGEKEIENEKNEKEEKNNKNAKKSRS